ncbi:MAG TPA: hypothetical protein VGN34_33615, partial [Ktedonobacteraceae bacterium]
DGRRTGSWIALRDLAEHDFVHAMILLFREIRRENSIRVLACLDDESNIDRSALTSYGSLSSSLQNRLLV